MFWPGRRVALNPNEVSPAALVDQAQKVVAAGDPVIAREAVVPRLYRPELDALRFFAFLSVFIFHSLNVTLTSKVAHIHLLAALEGVVQSASKFGLSLFFFLSAYLISTLLNIEKHNTQTIDLRAFYMRRALRIWPLYFAYIVAICLLQKVVPRFAVTAPQIALMLLFAGNWFFARHAPSGSVIEHLWSISVEEQFYLIFPTLVRLLPGNQLRRISIGGCALSLLATFSLATLGAHGFSIWTNSFTTVLFFAGGSLLSTYTDSPLLRRKKSPGLALLAVAIGLLLWLGGGAMFRMGDGHGLAYGLMTMSAYLIVL
jgi:peptidoglycan/LPS O-acetylase OafA/YrhL